MAAARQWEKVYALLEGLSDLDLRECCIQALRVWRARAREKHSTDHTFQMHGHFGLEVMPILAQKKSWPAFSDEELKSLKEAFLHAQAESAMTGVVEFTSWLVRAGLALPLMRTDGDYPGAFRLTRAGIRFLDRVDEDHPLLPGFVERVRSRCGGVPDDVINLLVDAQACLEHGLLRPSMVLMGVAYEHAVEAVYDSLVRKGVLPAAELSAAARITKVKEKIDALMPGKGKQDADDRLTVHAAYAFAHALRRRRNDASHTAPVFGFEDREEAEELLVSAGRHLPALWKLF